MDRKARLLWLAFCWLTFQQLAFTCGWRGKPVRVTSQAAHRKASPSTPVGAANAPNPEPVFDKIFQGLKPDDVYTTRPERQDYLQRLEANNLAIINDVDETMAHEVIDFDAKYWTNQTLSLAAIKPSGKKTFLATLRGSGGGKTRAVEELRWELLGMEGVLPLAITYNSAMELYLKAEFGWSTDYELNYAMTVVARLATVFYGVRLPKILPLLKPGDWASMLKFADADFALQLIRGFLSHAVKKLQGVHTIVVLADEVARAEGAFAKKYQLTEGADWDVTSLLRQAILDQEIFRGLQATLVISSLTLSPRNA